MFKTIFQKLLVTYLVIIIIVIGALSFILTVLYSRHVFEEKHQSLISAAFKVNQLANDFQRQNISQAELEIALDSLGHVTDAKIYLVKLDKQALTAPDTLKMGEELEDSFLIGDLLKILDGETVYRQKQYSDKFDMYMVFTGVPWKRDGHVLGAILLFSPVNHIANDMARINLVIWLTGLFFMVVSALVIYFNSRNISKPIKKMEEAAGKLAGGENTADLVVQSQDEIGKLAETFNAMKQQLLDTEKMRRDFIANVSHDLRTPLTSINGFVEGMLDGIVKPEDYPKYLHIIHDETNRLIRLTNDILQLAQIQSGSLKLNKEVFPVRDIVNPVRASIDPLIGEKALDLSVPCDAELCVYADKDRLTQILINMISNSAKYGEAGGTISLQVAQVPDGIRFSIKDRGPGIPPDELPFIFEKFYRVDKSRRSDQSGTGLGLNIVKNLVELHGGKIWAASEIGVGTEMVFELPNP
ncbi:sensor histidine kinase [Candidatus Formimonas warabiya]|uniref:histidine kinase n=1 Tax=Formimonas warabiya TaxID=1761012 RepID=A0A3G1KVZ2_FORW1|nr:ATP-binding protein [Candidatus Formimonas warabiya]ATW26601.1 hypothetical protein DCMF_19235 [Candidatus Formimonas warabiya]